MNIILVLIAVLLSSFLFTFLAIIVASLTKSLNSFIVGAIPVEIIAFLPSIFYLFNLLPKGFLFLHPGIATIMILQNNKSMIILSILSLILYNLLAFFLCKKVVNKCIKKSGGN